MNVSSLFLILNHDASYENSYLRRGGVWFFIVVGFFFVLLFKTEFLCVAFFGCPGTRLKLASNSEISTSRVLV